ncbi:phosphoglycerate mutase-like protein [Hypoxylon trugodes]|uniref:phosphoglycerate mutase-like protein n=1 Tax=Hypoxylon trugodes TaxID=326681 RepID=UPI0021909ADB|nr:phosphoglycerate mutase-like protein [Hypoxylon trugodes]KAI1388631.1 phosphoglycerate mutase-like protein [Hypoxylon trugodes]
MRILLIRHGESVDNVAGLYAGSRDSPLTNHGVLQIKKLGAYIEKRRDEIGSIEYIFTSTLQRAYQTAEAIADALSDTKDPLGSDPSEPRKPPEVTRLPELREKDYGSSEGKKYGVKAARTAENSVQSDSETHESMGARVDKFLASHLVPIVDTHTSDNITVVIVAHGIILGVLLKALLERFPKLSKAWGKDQDNSPEYTAWSNTGVLQAKLEVVNDDSTPHTSKEAVVLTSSASSKDDVDSSVPPPRRAMQLTVEFTNNTEHLEGLKKTRGGIGSAKFDSRQRTMDSFFGSALKKRKLDKANGK